MPESEGDAPRTWKIYVCDCGSDTCPRSSGPGHYKRPTVVVEESRYRQVEADLRFQLAYVFRDWVHESPLSQCNAGVDTCPDWPKAYELADIALSVLSCAGPGDGKEQQQHMDGMGTPLVQQTSPSSRKEGRMTVPDAPKIRTIYVCPECGQWSGSYFQRCELMQLHASGKYAHPQEVEVVEQSRLVEQLDQMWRDATAEPLTEERHGYKLAVFELKAWLASSAEPGDGNERF